MSRGPIEVVVLGFPVRDAIVGSGGQLLADLHIPPDVVEPVETRSSRWSGLLTPRRVVAVGLAALGLIFILQNRDDASLQLLGFQITGPQWLASLALLATGIVIGVLVGTHRPKPPR